MEDIGDPLLCKLGCEVFLRSFKVLLVVKDFGFRPDWYVEYIEVHCHGRSFFFCIYVICTTTTIDYSMPYAIK